MEHVTFYTVFTKHISPFYSAIVRCRDDYFVKNRVLFSSQLFSSQFQTMKVMASACVHSPWGPPDGSVHNLQGAESTPMCRSSRVYVQRGQEAGLAQFKATHPAVIKPVLHKQACTPSRKSLTPMPSNTSQQLHWGLNFSINFGMHDNS